MDIEHLHDIAAKPFGERMKLLLSLKDKNNWTQEQYTYVVRQVEALVASQTVSDANNTHAEVTVEDFCKALGASGDRGEETRQDGFQPPDDGTTPTLRVPTGRSQKARPLALLFDYKPHTTVQIQQVVYGANHLGAARIAARIEELRKAGHDIECEKHAGTIYKYTLKRKTPAFYGG